MRTNREQLVVVAERLRELRNRVVFLGGAATELLVTDPAAPPVRVTQDVDVIVDVVGRSDFYDLEAALRDLGFRHDQSVICRWTIDDVVVDVMPADPGILGFSNRWYPEAIPSAFPIQIAPQLTIRVVVAPIFVATKFEAYLGRGNNDALRSHDLGDVIAILDGREELEAEVAASPLALADYVRERLRELASHSSFLDIVAGHLPGDLASQERLPTVVERIWRIID